MKMEQTYNKFCELQYKYYYWCEPFGKNLGIFGTKKRQRNIKELVSLLKRSKKVWINKLNRTGENEANARLANILDFCKEGTDEDFIKIWDFIMDDNKKMKDFDTFYSSLYQSRKYS